MKVVLSIIVLLFSFSTSSFFGKSNQKCRSLLKKGKRKSCKSSKGSTYTISFRSETDDAYYQAKELFDQRFGPQVDCGLFFGEGVVEENSEYVIYGCERTKRLKENPRECVVIQGHCVR